MAVNGVAVGNDPIFKTAKLQFLKTLDPRRVSVSAMQVLKGKGHIPHDHFQK